MNWIFKIINLVPKKEMESKANQDQKTGSDSGKNKNHLASNMLNICIAVQGTNGNEAIKTELDGTI